jgi:nucleoside-diphosphate-sugar epimerase
MAKANWRERRKFAAVVIPNSSSCDPRRFTARAIQPSCPCLKLYSITCCRCQVSTQALSLVFVKDLAEAIVRCLDAPAVVGKRYFVAQKETVTARSIAEEIARQLSSWTLRCPLPFWVLWLVCLVNEAKGRLTGKAEILNLQKVPELQAPGWVCDSSGFASEMGMDCETNLTQGIKQTLAWYHQNSWL